MTPNQDSILSTLVYFLERYKKASIKNESSTGFEDIVFDQMIDTVKDLYQKYVQGVITKFLGVIREAAAKGIESLWDFLGIDFTASVSFGKM